MENPSSTPLQYISALLFFFSCFICINAANPTLRNDSIAIQRASNDYGNIVHETPSSVLYPSSVDDIVDLIKSSYGDTNRSAASFTVAARGRGHSVRGQAMTRGGGVVVDMPSLRGGVSVNYGTNDSSAYADVGGDQLWIDVLWATLKHGLAPVSWTDYLYLSVGGTLSNAGIRSFSAWPSNHQQWKGELVTCSKNRNQELFFGVLGGLGQFGIITRARIVKWVRLLYSDFGTLTKDQEHLISSKASNYVEGFLIANENTTSQWRSSFSSPSNQSDVVSLFKKNKGILYSIELVKYYHNQTPQNIDQEFEKLLKELNFIPGFIFTKDASFFDFLNRVGDLDTNVPKGKLTDSYPWLHLFVPKSRISDFNARVLATMIPRLNETFGLFLFYPLNRNKWDNRMSAVIPDEEVFYMLGLLHSTPPDKYHIYDKFNDPILRLCKKAGVNVKQYLPEYKSKQDWIKNYGSKWKVIRQRKESFDPKMILSPGQRIFN
ncbi:hypothetical protein ACP275_10G056000 [Erythranthe tilingii]